MHAKGRETVEVKEAAEALPSSPLKTFSLRSRLQTVNGRLEESNTRDPPTREYLDNVTSVASRFVMVFQFTQIRRMLVSSSPEVPE